MGSHESKQNQLFFWKVAALLEGKSEAKILVFQVGKSLSNVKK